jgi:hypothetical protein
MATKVKRSGGKASAKESGASSAKANGGETAAQRKRGELSKKLAKEAPAIAKRLAGGGKMKAEKERYGLSADTAIVKALAEAGFTSKGAKLEVEPIDASKAAGKKAVVKARKEGESWIILSVRTGLSEAELRKIVEEAGGPTGRVYRNAGGKSAGR